MATVAITAPSTSISKMAGSATPAITWPVEGEASTNCEAIKSAMDDIGVIAQPTHSACFQLAPLPTLPSATPVALATRRTAIRASTTPATGALQSACAATVETSTNTAATMIETPSTTTTGEIVSSTVTLCRLSSSALALPRVSAYSVDSVVSTMARSVTGPAARVSATTRVSTAGEAASATRASGPATWVGRFSHTSTQYTAK